LSCDWEAGKGVDMTPENATTTRDINDYLKCSLLRDITRESWLRPAVYGMLIREGQQKNRAGMNSA
jgi:hypothetical protein